MSNFKAVISLTSWKARINSVGITIFSLLSSCPGFHIVLCLSSDEFPKKEHELPEDLVKLAKAKFIEILWVKENYKAFKKVFFAMRKYPNLPVISADDDLIYCKNYAELLYSKWKEMPTSCVGLSSTTVTYHNDYCEASLWGYAQLFPPHFSDNIDFSILETLRKLGCIDDDGLYSEIRARFHINAFSFQLPFNNEYVACNYSTTQDNCITNLRTIHKQNDRDIFKRLLT